MPTIGDAVAIPLRSGQGVVVEASEDAIEETMTSELPFGCGVVALAS